MRKKLLLQSRLYAILDKKTIASFHKTAGSAKLAVVAEELADAGVDIIQLRDKESSREILYEDAVCIKKAFARKRVLFIINDYPDLAKIVDSDGVHLGQNDCSVAVARRILGPEKLIGVSCHSLGQALKAEEDGADYIGIGPVFPTPTKPEYKAVGTAVLRELKEVLRIPFFAIGNVNCETVAQIRLAGADRFAVCRDFIAGDNIRQAVREFAKAAL